MSKKYRPTISRNFPYGGYVDLEDKILEYIRDNPQCLVVDINLAIGVNDNTVRHALARLESSHKVKFIRHGVMKLYEVV